MRTFGFAALGAVAALALGALVVSFAFADWESQRVLFVLEGAFVVGAIAGAVVGVRTKRGAKIGK